MLVSRSIVQAILNGGGRFLQEQQTSAQTAWTEIQFRRAVQKTSQALRERSDDVHSPKNDDNVAEVDDQNRGNLAAPSAAATLTATSALQIEPFAYDKKPVDLSMNVKGAALHRKASTALVVPL